MWLVMACCEKFFVGISYATIGLDNRVVFTHVLIDILGASCLLNVDI